jgi:hypothetical protein
MRVTPNQLGADRATVRQHCRDPIAGLDDVIVREDEAVRREDDAGSAAAPGFDAHDRGADLLDRLNDGFRIRIE